jgi:hypothetical protein
MFVRKKRNKSGSVSVQIIDKSSGRFVVFQTIGSSSDPIEVNFLVDKAKRIILEHGNFIGWVGIVFVPIADVIQQVPQLGGYLPFVYTNVLVGFAKLTCPCPYIGIHAFMHHADELLCKNRFRLKGTSQCPLYGLFNILLLKLV